MSSYCYKFTHFKVSASNKQDLTNPSARAWMRKVIRCNMLGDQSGCTGNATAISAPIRGYMSDFAEYIPWDAYLWNGQSAAEVGRACAV